MMENFYIGVIAALALVAAYYHGEYIVMLKSYENISNEYKKLIDKLNKDKPCE